MEMMRPRTKRPAVQRDRPRLRRHKPADHIEERRLARPVRPDDPNNPPRRNTKRNIVERKQPTKPNRDVLKKKPLVSACWHGHLGLAPAEVL